MRNSLISFNLFPAAAGMNRHQAPPIVTVKAVPRSRGDEPVQDEALNGAQICSPQPRG